jgi:hypothetical protein
VSGSLSANVPAGVAGILDDYVALDVAAEITGGQNGTLDVYLQTSTDGGASWFDAVHFAQATAGASAKYSRAPLSQATATTAPVTVGKGLTPALGAGVVVNGAFGDRCRLVMVAGSGTTQGGSVIVRLSAARPRLREAGGS